MEAALVARDDLRSLALRRCIPSMAALTMLVVFFGFDAQSAVRDLHQARLWQMMAIPFAFLAVLEGMSFAAMVPMARVRDATGGPETGFWRFVQGPWPCVLLGTAYAGVAVVLWVSA